MPKPESNVFKVSQLKYLKLISTKGHRKVMEESKGYLQYV